MIIGGNGPQSNAIYLNQNVIRPTSVGNQISAGGLNKKSDKNKSVIQEFILNSNAKGSKQPPNNNILAFIPPSHNMSVNMQQNLASKHNSLF